MRLTIILLILGIGVSVAYSQTPRERSVELSATVSKNPAEIKLDWVADLNANSYTVYRKALEADSWGDPIAVLPGTATTYTDQDVEVGVGYEYAFYKQNFEVKQDTFCVPAGTPLNFTIDQLYGYGLCCNFGFGYYEFMDACGNQLAYGDKFGYSGASQFMPTCTNDSSCAEIVLTLNPDLFPHQTSWTLTNQATGEVIGSSGPMGTLVGPRSQFGYIYAGIELPALESWGTVLLLLEESTVEPLADRLDRLEVDLIREGYRVIRRTVSQEQSVPSVKAVIQEAYELIPDLTTAIIIGHVPVPYSGDIFPDAHHEHRGAWAADVYYAELNGNWTDETVDRATAFLSWNHNVPGDGKFDQGSIPTEVELQLGRVDFHQMPAFPQSEIELYARYLDKDHAYRAGQMNIARRALIDDNFNSVFAGPSSSAWRNFAQLFGSENIVEADYFSTLRNESYLFSYGCGSGTHISAAGVGQTSDFANDSLQTVFTMLFGSQFGDWDNGNNFLKSPLASGTTLTNCWAGCNPYWTLHHMAMGYPIGYSTIRTQNSTEGIYIPGPQLVHVALLGDPTLRLHVVKSPTDLTLEEGVNEVLISWDRPENEIIQGYYVYRAHELEGTYERISDAILPNPSFIDTDPREGKNLYAIRAVKLEESGSGSYYNLSPKIIDSIRVELQIINSTDDISDLSQVKLYPNPTSGRLYLDRPNAAEIGTLRLYDYLGRLQFQAVLPIGKETVPMDLEALPSGTYFWEVEVEGQFKNGKVVLVE